MTRTFRNFLAFSVILSFLFSSNSFGKQKNKRFVQSGLDTTWTLQKIDDYLSDFADRMFEKKNDSLYSEERFISELSLVLHKPETFDYSFNLLKNKKINIIFSDDSVLKIYNWLSPTTGGWNYFPTIIQFRGKKGKMNVFNTQELFKRVGDFPSTFYHAVYHIESSKNPLYLVIGSGQFKTDLPFDIIRNFSLDRQKLKISRKLFKIGKELSTDVLLSRQYLSQQLKGTQNKNIIYNSQSETLTYPEMTDEEIPKPTGKTIELKFNGKYFEQEK